MLAYRVDDMTCGHCASAITKAVRAVDAGARVEVDLSRHMVKVLPTEADARELRQAIADAGYTPFPVQVNEAQAEQPRSRGCCCASRGGSCD